MNLSRGRPAALAAALLGVFAFTGVALRSVSDPDVWWHLKAGAAVLAGRPGAFTEEWSFTAAGRPWVNHEWLAEAGFAVARRLGGDNGLVTWTGLVMGVVSLLLTRAAWLEGMPAPLIAVGLALAAAVTGSRFVPRPQIFSYFLLALWLERLATARRRMRDAAAPPRLEKRTAKSPGLFFMSVFPLLQVIWTNVHGPWIGLAIGSVLILGGALPSLPVRNRLLLVASLALASIAHPQGYRPLLEYARELGGAGLYKQTIREWVPLYQTKMPEALLTWACLAISIGLGAAGLVRRGSRDHGARAYALLLPGLAIAALLAVRNRDLMSIFLLPAAAVLIAAWRNAREWTSSRPAAIACFIVAIGLLVIPGAGLFGYPRAWPPRPRLSTSDFPVDAADFLEHEQVGSKIFNAYDYGGYLVDRLAPGYRVFIDGRYFVYGETVYLDYLEARDGGPRSREILDRSGADLLLVRYPRPDGYQALAARARDWPDWVLVFWDDARLIYIRRSAARPEWLARHEYGATDPTLPPPMQDVSWWRAHFRQMVLETVRAAREAPRAVSPLMIRGLAFEYSGRDGDAARAYRSVLRIDPLNRRAQESLARLGTRHPEGLPPGLTEEQWKREFGTAP